MDLAKRRRETVRQQVAWESAYDGPLIYNAGTPPAQRVGAQLGPDNRVKSGC